MDKSNERYIVKGFLNGLHTDYISSIDIEDFSSKETGQIFEHLKILDSADTLFSDGLINIKRVASATGMTVSKLLRGTENIDPVKHYALIEELIKSRVDRAAKRYTSGEIVIDELMDTISNAEKLLKADTGEELQNMGEFLALDFSEAILSAYKNKRIFYGFPALDTMTAGMSAGQLITIAGRTGTGKSAFALQIALNASAAGQKTLYFSHEMCKREFAERIIQQKMRITSDRIKTGRLTKDDYGIINASVDSKKFDNLFVIDSTRHFKDMRKYIEKYKPDLVIVDQLSLIDPDHHTNSIRERYIYLTRELKNIARKYNIPIIELAQLNRIEAHVLPQLYHLKESGSIEEDSDVVILLHKFAGYPDSKEHAAKVFDEFSDPEAYNGYVPYMLRIAKQRSGPTGKLPFLFNPKRVQFTGVTG